MGGAKKRRPVRKKTTTAATPKKRRPVRKKCATTAAPKRRKRPVRRLGGAATGGAAKKRRPVRRKITTAAAPKRRPVRRKTTTAAAPKRRPVRKKCATRKGGGGGATLEQLQKMAKRLGIPQSRDGVRKTKASLQRAIAYRT